jgi:hypothetical protein
MADDQQQGQQQGQQQQSQSQGQQQGQQGDQKQGQQQSQQQGQQQQGDQKQGDQKQTWPNTWREEFAGGDEKQMARLQRFTTPKDIFASYRALEQRLSAGELKAVTPFPKDGKPEEQSAWRKEQGLPEKPEAYDLTFDDGLVIGEEDKPFVDNFLKAAHAANYTPSQVKEALRFHYANQEAQAEAREQADADLARKTIDALRLEWGGDYRTNMNGISALLDTAPAGVKDKLKNSRTADGTPLMSDPDTLKFLVGMFRTINPVTTIGISGDDAAVAKGIDAELDSIKETMRTNRAKYNKDEKMQARYRELIAAKERMGGNKKAA